MEIPCRIVLRMKPGNGSPNYKEEFRMKFNKNRILTGALAAVLVLSVGATAAFAAGPRAGRGNGNFVDADNNGVCDNRGNGNRNFVDADNDGVCDNRGNGNGNFVDADNDGVCDNRGNGNGNFVDADNDGVCDNRDSGNRQGKGCHGRRG